MRRRVLVCLEAHHRRARTRATCEDAALTIRLLIIARRQLHQDDFAHDVWGERPPREVLYLGGNADLYVLVDPCNDDAVEMMSVGSSRIDIIDEVTCR